MIDLNLNDQNFFKVKTNKKLNFYFLKHYVYKIVVLLFNWKPLKSVNVKRLIKFSQQEKAKSSQGSWVKLEKIK